MARLGVRVELIAAIARWSSDIAATDAGVMIFRSEGRDLLIYIPFPS